MPAESPEATAIPCVNPLKRSVPVTPILLQIAAGAAITVYDESVETPCEAIWVHNLGLGVVNYAKNSVASDVSYHDRLAGESVAGDGLGTKVEFKCRELGIKKISLYAVADSAVSVEKNLKRYALHG